MSETTITPADVAARTNPNTEDEPDSEEESQENGFEQIPPDHPLVKRLNSQKRQLGELKELRVKAKRLDDIEEESEKAADRIAKAEQLAAAVPAQVAESLKAHLVTLHEIDSEDAELFLTANTPDLLLKQVERLLGQSGKRQRKNYVAREGENPKPEATSDLREFTRTLFGKGD